MLPPWGLLNVQSGTSMASWDGVWSITISQSILLSHGNRSGPYPGKNRGPERGVNCVVVVPRRRYSAIELVLASDSKKNTGKQSGSQPNKQQEGNSKEERKQGTPSQRLASSKEVGTGRQHKDDEAHHEIN